MKRLPALSPRGIRDALAMPTINHVMIKVRGALTRDLLKPAQRRLREQLDSYGFVVTDSMGHCYVASEAVYHIMGGRHSGLQPMVGSVNGTHWWLVAKDGTVVDPTADQFLWRGSLRTAFYRYGRKTAFLTKKPSKRAAEVIRRVRAANRRKAKEAECPSSK